jgi:quercetin dioxygenase-like cupin family protein
MIVFRLIVRTRRRGSRMEWHMSFGRQSAGLAIIALSLLVPQSITGNAQSSGARASAAANARPVFTHLLPKLDGEHLRVTIIEVTYRPGESSPSHTHACPVIGFVIQGTIRMKVKGEPERIYKNGQSFYEAPNGVHEVSANDSKTDPARFLAYFVCDRDGPLSSAPTNVPGSSTR